MAWLPNDSSSSGLTPVEQYTGASAVGVPGTNTTLTVTKAINATTTVIFINGLYMLNGTNYTISGQVITIIDYLTAADKISVY